MSAPLSSSDVMRIDEVKNNILDQEPITKLEKHESDSCHKLCRHHILITQMSDFLTFASSEEETRQVALHLNSIGCCPRCILRLIGEDRHAAYYVSQMELEKLLLPEENWSTDGERSNCSVCLGILQQYAEKSFFEKVVCKVQEEDYQFKNHMCSLILPICLIVRERSVFLHLQRKYETMYKGKESRIPSVKEVWKWVSGPAVADLMGSTFNIKSSFDILMNFSYSESDKECGFLLNQFPDTFRKRKQRKYGFETYTRANVGNAVSDLNISQMEKLTKCPPAPPAVECTYTVVCTHEAVFVAGRYQKYSRTLSQSPWWVGEERIMDSSVQELICEPILEAFKTQEHRFSSSGREDVDVRTLGLGRPFMVEIMNPRCTRFTAQDLAQLQKKINGSTKDIQVRDLQLVARDETDGIKEGEIEKSKSYCAYCWCARDPTQEDLDKLTANKNLIIHQKTPLRVLHRRALITRDRTIHSMKAEKISPHQFALTLSTQAGTYIKEFVHGDFGRTSPNLGMLLGADCDISDLDVMAVDVDWPPYIDPKTPSSADPTITRPETPVTDISQSPPSLTT